MENLVGRKLEWRINSAHRNLIDVNLFCTDSTDNRLPTIECVVPILSKIAENTSKIGDSAGNLWNANLSQVKWVQKWGPKIEWRWNLAFHLRRCRDIWSRTENWPILRQGRCYQNKNFWGFWCEQHDSCTMFMPKRAYLEVLFQVYKKLVRSFLSKLRT